VRSCATLVYGRPTQEALESGLTGAEFEKVLAIVVGSARGPERNHRAFGLRGPGTGYAEERTMDNAHAGWVFWTHSGAYARCES
jgi:hypothetical protein